MSAITNFHYADGRPTPLSNFYLVDIVMPSDGLLYPSVEHAYQASKTGVIARRLPFTHRTMTPGQARHAGRALQLPHNWEQVKLAVMRDLLRLKFAHPALATYLLDATGDAELIEGNTWGDRYWGVCDGHGQNWLGFLLMGVRAELRGRQA